MRRARPKPAVDVLVESVLDWTVSPAAEQTAADSEGKRGYQHMVGVSTRRALLDGDH